MDQTRSEKRADFLRVHVLRGSGLIREQLDSHSDPRERGRRGAATVELQLSKLRRSTYRGHFTPDAIQHCRERGQ